jgi:hypothetical protein
MKGLHEKHYSLFGLFICYKEKSFMTLAPGLNHRILEL